VIPEYEWNTIDWFDGTQSLNNKRQQHEATWDTGVEAGSCHFPSNIHHRTCSNLHSPVKPRGAESVKLSAQTVFLYLILSS
jgi:hypothetical protein